MSFEELISNKITDLENALNNGSSDEKLLWIDTFLDRIKNIKAETYNNIIHNYRYNSENRLKKGTKVKVKSHNGLVDYGTGAIVCNHFIFDKEDVLYKNPIFLGYAIDLDGEDQIKNMNFYQFTNLLGEYINEIEVIE